DGLGLLLLQDERESACSTGQATVPRKNGRLVGARKTNLAGVARGRVIPLIQSSDRDGERRTDNDATGHVDGKVCGGTADCNGGARTRGGPRRRDGDGLVAWLLQGHAESAAAVGEAAVGGQHR